MGGGGEVGEGSEVEEEGTEAVGVSEVVVVSEAEEEEEVSVKTQYTGLSYVVNSTLRGAVSLSQLNNIEPSSF